MHLIEVGHLTISLEHLILAEDSAKEPEPKQLPEGVYRLTIETGRVIDLRGELADIARRQVEASVKAMPPKRKPSFGRSIDPKTGREVRRPPDGV